MNEREIFTEALLQPGAAERAAFLDVACGADVASRRRIEELLALHEGSRLLLDHRPLEFLAEPEGPMKRSDPPSPETAIQQLTPFLSPSPRPGALGRLGHYDVLEVLGQGGFGIVARAFDDSLQRVVAVKVLAPHLATTSPPRKRFLREARAAAQVRHENVVQIYAVEEQPLPYLVMEFIEGPTLQQRLDRDGPLEAAEMVRLGQQVALGLAAAHAKGLIHRDVKPANILLEAGVEARAKLTDFGLARAGDDASLTQSGVLAGTPLYMSPEQARGEELDPRADLFSLGSVLYTMATGRPAFRARSTLAVLRRVAEDTPRPIREVMADVSPGLCAVILRLLEKDPAARFATAREAAEALSRCLTEPAPAPVAPRPRRRRAAAAVAAVALLIIGAVWLPGWFAEWGGEDSRRAEGANPSPKDRPAAKEPPDRADGRSPKGGKGTAKVGPPAPDLDTDRLKPNILVTSIADDGSKGTLRWAVKEANARPGPDTIGFDPKVFATPQTITLSQGVLTFTDPAQTTILGPAAGLTISGNTKSNIFRIIVEESHGPATVAIQGLTLRDGSLGDGNTMRGGAIGNTGHLFLDRVTVVGGHAYFGGGISNDDQGQLQVRNSTFLNNSAGNAGGAILHTGKLLTVINSTFTGNRAERGGAILIDGGPVTILNSTITANTSERGGGVVNEANPAGSLTILNTIVAGNKHVNGSADDLFGTVTAKSCLLGATGKATLLPESEGNLTGQEPRLGKLGRHGGPTETIPLLLGSPAIDAGNNALVPSAVRTDQRGRPRVRHSTVDIGAFEVQ